MKRPAFQFYPKDWRDEQSLRLCSMAARGLWIDLMCLMHSSDRYGHLELAGKAMTAEQVARLVGESAKDVKRWMAELTDNGVCSVTDQGVLFSRRMVRDEDIRNRRAEGGSAGAEHGAKGAEHGAKGGRPPKETGDKKPPFRSETEPSLEPPPAFAVAFASAPSGLNSTADLRSLSGKPDVPPEPAKQQKRSALTADARTAIEFLNKVTKHAYRADLETNLGPARARVSEFGLATVKRVIADRCDRWSDDPKMCEFLRPATLFAASNFANYAGQLPPLVEAHEDEPAQLFEDEIL